MLNILHSSYMKCAVASVGALQTWLEKASLAQIRDIIWLKNEKEYQHTIDCMVKILDVHRVARGLRNIRHRTIIQRVL